MSADNKEPSQWAIALGHFLGASLVAFTTLLISSGAFSIAWNSGVASLLSLPSLRWSESLACLVCLWILAAPFRLSRVRISRDASA